MFRRRILTVAGVVGGIAFLNQRLRRGGGPTRDVLGGETRRFRWRGEEISYTVAGEGEPLLLVHGIYAGASSFEFRKNFGELSKDFRVYALDLLGCGASSKPKRRYEPEDVAAQVEDFAREEIGVQAHLVASSLSAALIMPALVRSPRLFKRAVLICPTGYKSLQNPSGRLGEAVYGLFRVPILGDTLYHALVSRWGLRYYLGRMAYHDPAFVTDDTVNGYYSAGHGPGVKYLPAAFVAGKLNLSVAGYWPRVPQKTLVVWGEEAKTTPVAELKDFTSRNPRSEPRVFRNTALLPHDERAPDFDREVRAFLTGK